MRRASVVSCHCVSMLKHFFLPHILANVCDHEVYRCAADAPYNVRFAGLMLAESDMVAVSGSASRLAGRGFDSRACCVELCVFFSL